MVCIVKGDKEEKIDKTDSLPSSNQLLLGYKEIGSVKYEYNVLETNVMKDARFSGYTLRDEYRMIYLATEIEQEKELIAFLGIKDDLPLVDYTKKNLLISVGFSISDLSDKNKKTNEDGEKVIDITYNKTYSKDTAYVYSINRMDFLSGNELELYYLENLHINSNLEEVERDPAQIISEGKYHRIYQKAEEVYEFVVYNANNEVSSRRILEQLPIITEYNDTMVRLQYENIDQYYNPQEDFYTKKSNYSLHYLLGNIVVFVKINDEGLINFVVRDVYVSSKYSCVIYSSISCSTERERTVLDKVEFVDSTHLNLILDPGDGNPFYEETITIRDLTSTLVTE